MFIRRWWRAGSLKSDNLFRFCYYNSKKKEKDYLTVNFEFRYYSVFQTIQLQLVVRVEVPFKQIRGDETKKYHPLGMHFLMHHQILITNIKVMFNNKKRELIFKSYD